MNKRTPKRIQFSTTVDSKMYEKFREHVTESRIPISKLTDEMLEDFLLKIGKIEIKTKTP